MQRVLDPELAYRQFDTLYVETPRHKAINAALEESLHMMRRSSGSDMRNLLITGDSGMGKSMTLKRFRDRVNGAAKLSNPDALPILYVNTPEETSLKAMSTAILDALGDLFPGKSAHHVQMIRIRALMDEVGVLMVILDEFQHIFEGRSKGAIKTATQFIKNLENQLGRPIVLAGMRSIENLVRGSPELRRRFNTRLRIGRYLLKEPDSKEFLGFVKAVETALPLPVEEPFTDKRMMLALYCISGGIPDYLIKPLKLALSRALDGQQAVLREQDLIEAVNTTLDPEGQVLNPLKQDHAKLRQMVRLLRSVETDLLRRIEPEFAPVRFSWLDDI